MYMVETFKHCDCNSVNVIRIWAEPNICDRMGRSCLGCLHSFNINTPYMLDQYMEELIIKIF